MRRLTLRALVPTLFLLLVVCPSPLFALPAQQTAPPAQGQTTAVANLRSGPGTSFAKVGSMPAGKTVIITGCNSACDWYQLESGDWIAAFLVQATATATGDVPAAQPQATAATTSTVATPTPAVTPAGADADQDNKAAASGNGNLRAGPGTNYARVGSVQAGQALEITGQNAAGDWFQLADGNWVAALLVTNAPAGLAVVEAPAAPAAEPAASPSNANSVSGDEVMQEAMRMWQDRIDLNSSKTCGHFEYKLTDVRRKKSLWLYNSEYVAQGEWLMVFVEVKNISPGTSHLGQFGPRLVILAQDGVMSRMAGDWKASWYAGWMFQHGGFYDDINPGKVLGLVEAYDVALDPDKILGFGLLDCPDDMLSLGVWSKVPPAAK